jgi:hypothetical protein
MTEREHNMGMIAKLFRRPPDFVIGSADSPYMLRWWIIPRNRWFNIYLHKIVRDDDDRALHDHPWPSLSIVLRGGYVETTPAGKRTFKAGSLIYRSSTYRHRLEILDGACWTLFLTGPRVRDWGFWCPQGFVPWQEFCDSTNTGNVGRGCGEQVTATRT